MNTDDPAALAAEGQRLYRKKEYLPAAQAFAGAAQLYAARGARADEAEQRNNRSVALLQGGQARPALDAAEGTDQVFAGIGDRRRQAIAIANQAAALADLGRRDEAMSRYRRASELLADAGEGDLQALVLKSIAALELKSGRLGDASAAMLGSLGAVRRPTLLQRLLKFLVRIRPW